MKPSGRPPTAALSASPQRPSSNFSSVAEQWIRANGICHENGDRRMLKYLVAASMALVIAALVSYAVLATMGSECSSGNALPKFLSQSDPNTPNSKAEKTNPGNPGTNL